MTTDEAISIVARRVLASLAADASGERESYPKIGESDWARVVERVQALARSPKVSAIAAARVLLAERAEAQ